MRVCKTCQLPCPKGRRYHKGCRIFKLIKYVHRCPGCERETTRHRRADEQPIKTCMGCYKRGGSSNPNWKGGVRAIASQLRVSDRMKAWRKSVFERDGYTCVLCGQVGGQLQADHVWPFAWMPELALETWNGRTLCVSCHKQTPTYSLGTVNALRSFLTDKSEREAFYAGRLAIYESLLTTGEPFSFLTDDVDAVLIPLVGPR